MQQDPDKQVLSLHNDFNELHKLMSNETTIGDDGDDTKNDNLSSSLISKDEIDNNSLSLSNQELSKDEILNNDNINIDIPPDLPPQFIDDYIKYANSLPIDGSSLLCDADNFLMNMESQQTDYTKSLNSNNRLKKKKSLKLESFINTWPESIFPLKNINSNNYNNNNINNTMMIPSKVPIEGMTLLLSVLCTNIRSIESPTLKVKALQLLIKFSAQLTDYCRLQRIVPYIISVLHDKSAIVKSHGLLALSSVLDMVYTVPASDVHIFPEYIMPAIDHLSIDPETIVRESYARHLPKLAEIARRFLESSQVLLLQQSEQFSNHDFSSTFTNYDSSLQEIHGIFKAVISAMFWKDCPSCVKRALLPDISRLAIFFGKKETSDFLLPMVVTFLNENDWELRSSFFENVVGLCEYVGGHSLESYIYPCILQALSDKEEFVIDKAINALASMADKKLLRKQTMYDVARKTSPLLLHPNIWIRNSVISTIDCIGKQLDNVDRFTFLSDLIRPFLVGNIVDTSIENLEAMLLQPLSRDIFEAAVHACNMALQKWASTPHAKPKRTSGHIFAVQKPIHPYDPNDSFIKIFIESLNQKEISESIQKPILLMSSYIKDVARHVTGSESRTDMNIFVSDQVGIPPHSVILPEVGDNKKPSEILDSSSEWNYLTHFLITDSPSGFRTKLTANEREEKIESKLQTYDLLQAPPQLPDFGNLRKYDSGPKTDIKTWKPTGTLVAHLTQHKQAVNQLKISEDNQFFASCSNDGTVRIWDCQKLEKKVTNRSRLIFDQHAQGGKLLSLSILEHSHSIACGSENGRISIFRVESEQRKDLIDYKQCTPIERVFSTSGAITSMDHFNKKMQSLLVCSTSAGFIHGFDLRIKNTAFELDNTSKAGAITSMIIDSSHNWLLTGTVRGCYTCWDLRFNIPVAKWWQPGNDNHIYKLASMGGTKFLSSVGNGEVYLWDIKGQTMKGVWQVLEEEKSNITIERNGESPTPKTHAERLKNLPLQTRNHRALLVSPGYGYFFTGSTDKCLRYWNLANISRSFVVSGLNLNQQRKYVNEKRDGLDIYQEIPAINQYQSSSSIDIRQPGTPSVNHHDSILDIALAEQPLNMIISASRDGVIKVWK